MTVKKPKSTVIFFDQSRHKYFRESGLKVSHIMQKVSAVPARGAFNCYVKMKFGFCCIIYHDN